MISTDHLDAYLKLVNADLDHGRDFKAAQVVS